MADLHALERFELVRIPRAEIKKAPYNPRTMDASARERLKAGIERHGLISPPTWNRRTGNLVGGHQRLGVLDSLAESKDYELTVAAVDLDEAGEVEANLLLNNAEAQGEWDIGKLAAILKTEGLKVEGTGFDHASLYQLFGDLPLADAEAAGDGLAEVAEKLREAREFYDRVKKRREGYDDFYVVVVFADREDRNAFLGELELKLHPYQSGKDFRRLYLDEGEGEELCGEGE